MEHNSIVLIHKKEGKFLKEGIKIKVDECYDNIKSFYEEDNLIFLVLNLEKDFTDEEFDKIFEDFCYEDFEDLGVCIYPKDNEYYPTFIVEVKYDYSDNTIKKIDDVLKLFKDKVVKIYCNN